MACRFLQLSALAQFFISVGLISPTTGSSHVWSQYDRPHTAPGTYNQAQVQTQLLVPRRIVPNLNWAAFQVDTRTKAPESVRPQHFQLEPRRFHVLPSRGGQQRLSKRNNDLSYAQLNSSGKIWDRTPSGQPQTRDFGSVISGRGSQVQLRTGLCQRTGYLHLFKSSLSRLTDRMGKHVTWGNLAIIGSSIAAATIPLAALMFSDSPNLGFNRMRIEGTEMNHDRPGIQGRVDSVMGWLERSVEHLPNFPRLHPQECVKRSICEAHNEPDRHGLIGFILRLFFPASNLSTTDRMDDMEYKVINKYRHAAGFGLNKRLDNNGTGSSSACREKYEDCLVSLLDVAQNLIDIFLRK